MKLKLFIGLCMLSMIGLGCGGGDTEDTPSEEVSSDPIEQSELASEVTPEETTTTTTTTTTTVVESANSFLEAEITKAEYDDMSGYLDTYQVNWSITNISDKTVRAYQLELITTAADALGRLASVAQHCDATKRPIAPGETIHVVVPTVAGGERRLHVIEAAMEEQIDTCTIGAVTGGSEDARIIIDVAQQNGPITNVINFTRVVFDDGSSVGDLRG